MFDKHSGAVEKFTEERTTVLAESAGDRYDELNKMEVFEHPFTWDEYLLGVRGQGRIHEVLQQSVLDPSWMAVIRHRLAVVICRNVCRCFHRIHDVEMYSTAQT